MSGVLVDFSDAVRSIRFCCRQFCWWWVWVCVLFGGFLCLVLFCVVGCIGLVGRLCVHSRGDCTYTGLGCSAFGCLFHVFVMIALRR